MTPSQKVAIVTGASRGIGRATALAFAQQNTAVVLSDVNTDAGEQLARQIVESGGQAIFVRCDVSKDSDVSAMVEAGVKKFGRIDYAFNNAGIEGTPSPLSELSDADWERTIQINLKGVWLCMKYEIPVMQKQGGGSIVNCASIAGVVGFPNLAPYVASKHGVIGLTQAAALELAPQKIRVNAVCPGVIQTPMIDRFTHQDPQAYAALVQGEPVARIGKPEEIADAVLWLCSDRSSFVTGHPLVVDGGWVAR